VDEHQLGAGPKAFFWGIPKYQQFRWCWRHSRRCFLATDLEAQQSLLLRQRKKAKSKRYNVVVLMADDLGYGDVGFNGKREDQSRLIWNEMSRSGITSTISRCILFVHSHTGQVALTAEPFAARIFRRPHRRPCVKLRRLR